MWREIPPLLSHATICSLSPLTPSLSPSVFLSLPLSLPPSFPPCHVRDRNNSTSPRGVQTEPQGQQEQEVQEGRTNSDVQREPEEQAGLRHMTGYSFNYPADSEGLSCVCVCVSVCVCVCVCV